MAQNIKVEIFSFSFKQDRDERIFRLVDDFDQENQTLPFWDFVRHFANEVFDSFIIDEDKKETYSRYKNPVIFEDLKEASFQIHHGKYGLKEILISQQGEEQGVKRSDQSGAKPYFGLISCDTGGRAYLALQYYGNDGILTRLKKEIRHVFRQEYGNWQIKIEGCSSVALLLRLIDKNPIEELFFSRKRLPRDKADALGFRGDNELQTQIKFIANRGNLPIGNEIKRFLTQSGSTVINWSGLSDLGINGEHETKVKISLDGILRTIPLDQPESFKIRYDVSNEVTVDADGYPNEIELLKVARAFLNTFETQ